MIESTQFAEALKENDNAFERLLPDLLRTDRGRCALLRDGVLVRTYSTMSEAANSAQETFPDGLYILRKVSPRG